MAYISVREAAERWDVSLRWVQQLCVLGRIEGAARFDNHAWMIPTNTKKPDDPRIRREAPKKILSADLAEVLAATNLPMPWDDPDAILNAVSDGRQRLQCEGILAYFRGDFERTRRCYYEAGEDDAAKLSVSPVAVAAAISLGDYPFFEEMENDLKAVLEASTEAELTAFAELCLAGAYLGAFAPGMAPDWLKQGDFSALPPPARPHAAHMRAGYYLCTGNYESMLAIAQTALSFCASERGFLFKDVYFRVMCAIACNALRREDEAERYLLSAMRLYLPHGFITPFAENMVSLGGLLEQCLEREFPAQYDAVVSLGKRVITNWNAFHNRFTKDHITLILSMREGIPAPADVNLLTRSWAGISRPSGDL